MNGRAILTIFNFEMARFWRTPWESLAAPVVSTVLYFVVFGAAASKAILIAFLILITSFFFVGVHIAHPFWMLAFLFLTAFAFSLLGFIIGLWAKNFEQLQIVPMMVITPLVFLGGAFYSASMLPPFWEAVAKLNPVLYLISGFRWAFFDMADVPVGLSLFAVALMIAVCMFTIRWIFLTGWRLRE